MKNQEKQLNEKLKKHLKGNRLRINDKVELPLTDDEIWAIENIIAIHSKPYYSLPTYCHVTRRLYIDFIGFDNPEYLDVIIYPA